MKQVPRPSDGNSKSAYFSRDKVLGLIEAPSIIERYKAYLEYAGRPIYLEYVTRPTFELN
ncbi:MAG: hypothetical protein K2G55_13525 [Lachnospiraceae bacterium]|nr:hypothetical protein [Lachnospiraceae bacterium]MDE7200662.1 hypothetical protein [Lachnospiraceae bacterium]